MYISVKHDSIAQYWESKEDFLLCELKAYVNDVGHIVIPAPYYSANKEDYLSPMSYNMNEFTKEEAIKNFARNYSDGLAGKYFYKLHYIGE
jgi:hypothetical protein